MHNVLVVDDHAPWRHKVCAELQESAQWRIVGEVADGLEAVRQTQAAQPDLILLDIGLPSLNGLEAARRIIASNPASKILFVSEHQSWDVAQAALATGARGYLCKSDAGGRLLPAMDAIIGGLQLVSAGLTGDVVQQTLSEVRPGCRHVAAFYADETSLLEDYARFAEGALAAGSMFILVGDSSRRDQLREKLQPRGVALDRLVSEGRYLFVDFAAESAKFMVDGQLDEARFREALTPGLEHPPRTAAGGRPRIVACGEGAPGLWKQGNGKAAIGIERVWNELSKTWGVDTLCAYTADVFRRDGDSRDVFQGICTAHSAVHFRRGGRVR